MMRFLHNTSFIFVFYCLLSSASVTSQYTITGNVNASSLTCSTFAGVSIIYVGNGVAAASLVMDTDLNLTTCGLSGIQLIVRNNASLVFPDKTNNTLSLPANSSIVIESGTPGGTISTVGSCSASDLITIGGVKVASCQGGSSLYDFDQIVANGGYNYVKTVVSPLCGSSIGSIGVSVFPAPTAATTYKLYSTATGGIPISTATATASPYSTTINTALLTTTTTLYIEATTGLVTTARKPVVMTVNPMPNNVTNGFSAAIICAGGSPQLTYDAVDASFSLPYTVVYKNNTTGIQYSIAIPTASAYSFTPADNPTSNTGYTLVSITNATCTNTNVSSFGNSGANLVVRPLPTATISPGTSVCIGAIAPTITFTNPQTVSITISYTLNSVPQSINVSPGVPETVLVPTTVAGSYVYNLTSVSYQTNATCPNPVTGSATVIVGAIPTIPTIVSLTQPTCLITTGSVQLGNLPATGTWTINPGGYTGTGSTFTISGLAAGSYNFAVSSGGCTSPTVNVPINPVVTNKWTGSWSTGANPVATEKIEFAGNYTANADVVACSCEVLSGSVTFNTGTKLTLTNDLKVTGGSLTFEDSASLVQINNVTNSGNIRYRRATQGAISNFDYTYWSSPVSPQTLLNVSPFTLGDKFYSFNGAADSWVQEASSTVMAKGIGYIIRGPQTYAAPNPPSFYQATFIGVPNNGTINIPITSTGEASYLLGNPYPSALDAASFMKSNPLLVGALYFWTHGTKIGAGTANLGSGSLAYTSDDYASYTLTGGAAASSGGAIPTGQIGSGQGFFVTTIGSGTVNFTNTMRVGVGLNTGSNSQFFKTQAASKTAGVEYKQALIGYVSGATNDIDGQYDGESFDANEYVDFYSIVNTKNLVIQGRAVPFDNDDKVILGYKTTIAGEFTIKINQFDGLFDTQEVFIEDKMLNKIHDLKKGEYTFATEKGTFNDRFVMLYSDKKSVASGSRADGVSKLVMVSTTEKEIKITTSNSSLDAVVLYDLSGKEIFNKEQVNNTEYAIRNLRKGNTVYIIKIKLEDGQIMTQKVIY